MTMESRPRDSHCVERVQYWQPEGVERCLAASAKYYVGLMKDGCTVLKYPQINTENALKSLRKEGDRYSHLGKHDSLVVFKGFHKSGLLFEYYARGSLREVIQDLTLTDTQKQDIGKQITSCLVHLHNCNFIHCDLNVNNVFVTPWMEAKVGDIEGQLYKPDGTVAMPTMSQENAKSRHPAAGEDEFSPRTDIFALGTLLYHLWHSHPPFPELDEHAEDAEIRARFRRGEYPISKTVGMDVVICKCWNSDYVTADEVLDDMNRLECGLLQSTQAQPGAAPPWKPPGRIFAYFPDILSFLKGVFGWHTSSSSGTGVL